MPTALQLKKDIQLNTDLISLLSVIEDIAVAQFHTLDKKKQRFKKLLGAFEEFFSIINFYQLDHPLVKPQNENMAIIMITSDEGFMGGLNNKVINAALVERGKRKAELLIVGSRGGDYLKGLGEKYTSFPGIDLAQRYQQAEQIRDYIMQGVKEDRFGHCILSFARAVSFSVQKIEVEKILPCASIHKEEAAVKKSVQTESKGLRGLKGLLSEHEGILIESSLPELLEYLAGSYIVEKLFLVFEENKLAEFGARANHLEGSCQHLKEEGKKIKLEYLKLAHAMVDRSMRETFSSQILKKKKGK